MALQLSKQEVLQCTRETLAMLNVNRHKIAQSTGAQNRYMYAANNEQSSFPHFFVYTFSFLSISVFDSFQFSQFFFFFFHTISTAKNFTKHQTPNEQPVERKLVSMGRLLTPLGR